MFGHACYFSWEPFKENSDIVVTVSAEEFWQARWFQLTVLITLPYITTTTTLIHLNAQQNCCFQSIFVIISVYVLLISEFCFLNCLNDVLLILTNDCSSCQQLMNPFGTFFCWWFRCLFDVFSLFRWLRICAKVAPKLTPERPLVLLWLPGYVP